jgi:hypothetical protein
VDGDARVVGVVLWCVAEVGGERVLLAREDVDLVSREASPWQSVWL